MVFASVGCDIAPPSEFALRMRPWFTALLLMQVILVAARWWAGDPHGALLMLMVTMVGALAVTAEGGVDVVYCTYYGLMAFVSGLMDTAIIIEKAVWSPWLPIKPGTPFKTTMLPLVHLLCAMIQLASALLSYKLYKDSEEMEAQTLLTTEQQTQ